MPTPIFLTDSTPGAGAKITQLYPYLELFSDGDPARHTLFVLGKAPLSALNTEPDQMLIIDPPPDVTTRFSLEGNVAALFCGAIQDVGLPPMETQPGGVAHLRIGDHFLDVYSQSGHNIIHLPALGILWGGPFGSDALPPQLAGDSDGSTELETLRLLAGLLKRNVKLYIPTTGEMSDDPLTTMRRLADDVGYLLHLQRAVPPAVARGDDWLQIEALGATLLPETWRSPLGRARHGENLRILFARGAAA